MIQKQYCYAYSILFYVYTEWDFQAIWIPKDLMQIEKGERYVTLENFKAFLILNVFNCLNWLKNCFGWDWIHSAWTLLDRIYWDKFECFKEAFKEFLSGFEFRHIAYEHFLTWQ